MIVTHIVIGETNQACEPKSSTSLHINDQDSCKVSPSSYIITNVLKNLEIGYLVVKIFPLFLFPGKPIIILEILHFQCRHDLKLGARRPALKPGLLRRMREDRLRFCRKYEDWSEDDWMR